MKYEISEEQYAEFLNTLTRKQQVKRTIQNISGATIDRPFAFNTNGLAPQYRDAIRCVNNLGGTDNPLYFFCDLNNNNIPNELNDGQNIALIYFGWIDGAAYADWAGLRPMTELEFEKACRGTEYPVAGEFAWHAKRADSTEYTITQNGQADEYPGNPGTGARANAAYTKTTGHSTAIETPLRCGIFATSSSDRSQSGASYYGIMELSGNINEGCVTIGHIDGRKYKGTHGDGELTATEGYEGNATNSDWPGIDINNPGYGVISSTGTGSRGGDWNDGYIMVSERVLAAGDPYGRNPGSGFRCVRTINN